MKPGAIQAPSGKPLPCCWPVPLPPPLFAIPVSRRLRPFLAPSLLSQAKEGVTGWAIHESFQDDRHYVYGIGLDIVLDVGAIDQKAIEMAIDRILAVGETDWESPDPVLRDRLPTVTQMEALAQAQYPSVYLGRAVRSDP